jgi:hypothetical protein
MLQCAESATSNGTLPPAASSASEFVDPTPDMAAMQLTRRDSFEVSYRPPCVIDTTSHCCCCRADMLCTL